jgi:RNA polymerase-binding transcription factor DksA
MATAKKAPAKQVSAKPGSGKHAPAKKSSAPVKATSSKKAAPAKAAAPAKKKAAPAGKKAAPAKGPAPKKAAPTAKKAVPAPTKKVAAKKAAPAPAKKVAAKKAAPAPAKKEAAKKAAAPPAAPLKKAPAKKAVVAPVVIEAPVVKGVSKDGVAYTKDFDVKFLTAQRTLLLEERAALLGQATRLEDEANSLIEEQEMGDVQFDDEGGEGDTMVVERERDLTLSAQARQTIADIESALDRLTTGRYGYSLESGRPIPRERLEAIPWATMLVEEKVGGIGRR